MNAKNPKSNPDLGWKEKDEELGEVSRMNSEIFAAQFYFVKLGLQAVDWEYAEKLIEPMRDNAGTQETMIIFNPGYPLKKIEVLRLQAGALQDLVNAVKKLKECDRLKKEMETDGDNFAEIQKLFF